MSATGRRKRPFAQVTPSKGKKPPRESIAAWWHPSRPGVASGPSWFRARLSDVDPDLDLTWNPLREQYQVYLRAPKTQHPICWGWTYLFAVHPTALDSRVFHRLYSASQRKWGSGKAYFDAVEREMMREKTVRDADQRQDTLDRAMEVFDHSQIRVGYGPSNGSKFQRYHS